MKTSGIAGAIVIVSLLAGTGPLRAGDGHQNHNFNNNGSWQKSFHRHDLENQLQKYSQAVKTFKKKHHPEQPPGKPPVVPLPPIVTDPVPPPKPIVRDHRTPKYNGVPRPRWPVDASNAPGGTVVTTTPKWNPPVVRDHRKVTPPPFGSNNSGGWKAPSQPVVRDHRVVNGQGGVTVKDVWNGGRPPASSPIVRDHRDDTGPIIRDHRNDTGPIIRDHRNLPVVRDHRK